MTTTVTRPRRKKQDSTVEQPPDLYRDAAGYKISVVYIPDISAPESAHVIITDGKDAKIDSFEVPCEGDHLTAHSLEVFRHPAMYSEPLRVFLGGKPAEEK